MEAVNVRLFYPATTYEGDFTPPQVVVRSVPRGVRIEMARSPNLKVARARSMNLTIAPGLAEAIAHAILAMKNQPDVSKITITL